MPFWRTKNKKLYLYNITLTIMATNSKYTEAKNGSANATTVKHYGNSPYVEKKTEEARKTLQKFPVPEKYSK